MQSSNDLYGVVSIHADLTSDRPPIRIYPDDSTPSISLSPYGSNVDGRDSVFISASRENGVTIYDISKGDRPMMSIRDRHESGSILSIPGITTTDLLSPSRLLVSDSNDRVGTTSSLPIHMGGTGLSTVISPGTILMSDGSGYTSLSAGTGINIDMDSRTISSTLYDSSSTHTIDSNGIGMFVSTYTATTTGTHVVSTINVGGYNMINMSISSSMYRLEGKGGVSHQRYRICNDICTTYDNNAASRIGIAHANVNVVPSVTDDVISLSVDLQIGDTWKGYIQIVSI